MRAEVAPAAVSPVRLLEVAKPNASFYQQRHRYSTGARLKLLSGGRELSRASAICVILRQLPFEGKELQYQVKSDVESWERVVSEGHLAPITE